MFRKRALQTQQGQTLIETMVAVFVLVMGITASLGLANYSLNATTSIRKQIIGMGLAREGIEAVKNMRDINWLQTSLATDCYNYYSSDNTGFCYKLWIDPASGGVTSYQLTPGTYVLNTDTTQTGVGYWSLASRANNFGLNYDSSSNPVHGLYSSWVATSHAAASSDYARVITISVDNTTAPFNNATLGPRVLVSSAVWWKDRRCPASESIPAGKCVIKLETYLTNWKDF